MLDSNDKGRPASRPLPPALSAMLRASDGILDMLPIATFICDARGTILQYNRRAAEIWGRAPGPGQTHEQFSAASRFCELDGTPMTAFVAGRGSGDRNTGARRRAHGRTCRRHASDRVGQHRSASQCQGRPGRRGELLSSTSPSASASMPRSSNRACARSSRSNGWRRPMSTPRSAFRKSRPTAASCASMKRYARSPALAASNCSPASCLPTPIPTMPIRTAKAFASRSPANSNSIRWKNG